MPLALSSALDMRSAREFKRSLETRYLETRPCVIDASAVTSISTGCLQILIAFAAAMRADGKTVTIERPSPAFRQVLSLLGLSETLAACVVET